MCEFSCGLELFGHAASWHFCFFSPPSSPNWQRCRESRSYDTILVEKQLEKNDLECIAKRNCQTFFFGLYNLLLEDYIDNLRDDCFKPTGSMYGISTYIYHKNRPNVGKYTIHGSCGKVACRFSMINPRGMKL